MVAGRLIVSYRYAWTDVKLISGLGPRVRSIYDLGMANHNIWSLGHRTVAGSLRCAPHTQQFSDESRLRNVTRLMVSLSVAGVAKQSVQRLSHTLRCLETSYLFGAYRQLLDVIPKK